MRVACNDYDDRAALHGYAQFNKHTHTYIHLSRLIRGFRHKYH